MCKVTFPEEFDENGRVRISARNKPNIKREIITIASRKKKKNEPVRIKSRKKNNPEHESIITSIIDLDDFGFDNTNCLEHDTDRKAKKYKVKRKPKNQNCDFVVQEETTDIFSLYPPKDIYEHKANEITITKNFQRFNKPQNTPYAIAQSLLLNYKIVKSQGSMYIFDTNCYRPINKDELSTIIMDFCRAEVERKGDSRIVDRIYETIDREINIVRGAPNRNPYRLVFKNGFLDIRSNEFSFNKGNLFYTSYIDCEFTPHYGNCPNFTKFIQTISAGNKEIQDLIWETLGYIITDDMMAKSFFVFKGAKDSGKSVLGSFIKSMFNKGSVTSIDLYDFHKEFILADIKDAKINIAMDLPYGKLPLEAVSKLKKITGGDYITCNRKYLSPVQFICGAKLLFATNHAIEINGNDDAFYRRMVTVPFTVSIPIEKQDKLLLEKLESEKLSVIMTALSYYKKLVANNYIFTQLNEEYTPIELQSISTEEILEMFVNDCCRMVDGNYGTFTNDLYNAYGSYCTERNLPYIDKVEQFSRLFNQLYNNLRKDKWRPDSGGNPLNGYRGIVLII